MQRTPVARSWVVMMRGGFAALDWGNGLYLDLTCGQFFTATEKDVSHRASDADLDLLVRLGCIEGYDRLNVYLTSLPEPPHEIEKS
ncbi:hypothetical protein [Anaerolinea sp.]|uniref:hypothetical protein n=1 Tax=Anaerolinea sp. TaxID=1872519 RepID=UPI002ACDF46C|nr:hypothetical protein [Anaerolinea sp.]